MAAMAIGGGISAYGQIQAGKTAASIAEYNARSQAKAAADQAMGLQIEAANRTREAEANYQLRSIEAQSRLNNAVSLENYAEGVMRTSRAADASARIENERAAATQQKQLADSGALTTSGTPLSLLADMAHDMQRDSENRHWETNNEVTNIFREAESERLGGKIALAGATLDRSSALSVARLTKASARGVLARGSAQAGITRAEGAAARYSSRIGAASTIFSTASSLAMPKK